MSHSSTCLNCNSKTAGNFCFNCGQKTDTHRITLKHFLFHDILHGVWHFEKGILFTIKEAILRPGKAALEYIAGKRIKYYNVFYLILILIGLGIFIENLYNDALIKYVHYSKEEIEQKSKSIVLDFIAQYIKVFLAIAIPIFSLNSYILFNKKKYNYSEHLIIFGMMYLGIIIITLIGNLMYFSEFIESISFISNLSNYFIPFALIIYLTNGFYGAFGKDYSKINFILRLIIFIILGLVYLRILGFVLKIILT